MPTGGRLHHRTGGSSAAHVPRDGEHHLLPAEGRGITLLLPPGKILETHLAHAELHGSGAAAPITPGNHLHTEITSRNVEDSTQGRQTTATDLNPIFYIENLTFIVKLFSDKSYIISAVSVIIMVRTPFAAR
jgi:hypothetical protein